MIFSHSGRITDRVRVVVFRSVAIVLLTLSVPSRIEADFTAYLTVETTLGDVVSQVRLVTYFKDEWRRRELHGEGLLKAYLGDYIELTNRTTKTRVRIYPESEEYVVDTVPNLLCGPFSAIDLNLLGSVRSRVRGKVAVVDTTAVIEDCLTVPVDIIVASRYGGDTHIRFWMCETYSEVFGTAVAKELNCGSSDGSDLETKIQAAVLLLQEQFRLRDKDAALLNGHLVGYPMRVESYSRSGETAHSSTSISTDSLVSGSLPDSLFSPPLGYRRR